MKSRTSAVLIHAETAEVLAEYTDDFYAGRPAVTVNRFGKGKAYYIASRNTGAFHDDFYGALSAALSLKRNLETDIPEGVTVQMRTDGESRFLFIMNFTGKRKTVDLGGVTGTDLFPGSRLNHPYAFRRTGPRLFGAKGPRGRTRRWPPD